MSVLGLLSSAVSGPAALAAPLPPDVVTVNPNITADISAPFAVGRGAVASANDPLANPRGSLLGSVSGGDTGGLVLVIAAVGAVLVLTRKGR